QLMGALIAARASGLSFEQIAEVFKRGGLVLTASTLRSYYFELKTEAETSHAAKRHADKVLATRKQIEREMLEIHSQHGEKLASEHAKRANAAVELIDGLAENAAAAPSSPPAASPQVEGRKKSGARPVRVEPAAPPPTR